ncbi:MAG: glutaminase A [Clostridiales bacterium]|nr:glutaminase A [Candidatus Crickella merdequi]
MKDREETIRIVTEAYEEARKVIPEGHVATYIPELGKVDPNQLGICLYRLDKEKICVGDYNVRFTMQSVSKVISLCVALELLGPDKVFDVVGAEPSGEAFNSIAELDLNSNKPYNPLINSGALAVAGLLVDKVSFYDMLSFAKKLCVDDEITFNEAAYESEMKTCSRNRAIGYLLESKDIIKTDVEETLKFYTKLCSLNVTAESLANFAKILASDGVCAKTGQRYLSGRTVRIVKTLMLTCGMYDGSGTYAIKVGIPTKSGVGGGLLCVSDKRAGIGVFGPALDAQGNSIAGINLLERISQHLSLNLFYDPDWEDVEIKEKLV